MTQTPALTTPRAASDTMRAHALRCAKPQRRRWRRAISLAICGSAPTSRGRQGWESAMRLAASHSAWRWLSTRSGFARSIDGRDHDPVHHRAWSLEEILIVRTLGRAVGHNQRRLPAPAGTPAALGVIGWCRGHVTQIHDVHRRNIDTQLHCGRAEERGQKSAVFPQLLQPFRLFGKGFLVIRPRSENAPPSALGDRPRPEQCVHALQIQRELHHLRRAGSEIPRYSSWKNLLSRSGSALPLARPNVIEDETSLHPSPPTGDAT